MLEDLCEMDLIMKYYNANRIFLLCLGLWPYKKNIYNKIHRVCMLIIFTYLIMCQLMIFITADFTVPMILEVLSTIFISITFIYKYNLIFFKVDKIKLLLERIQYDWDMLKDPAEIEIMKQQAIIARWYTKFFALIIYTITFLVIAMHYLPLFLDIVISLSESRARRILVIGEMFIDQQKYFHVIVLCIMMPSFFFGTTTIIAAETMLMVLIQHACGLLKVTSHRITRAFYNDHVPVFSRDKKCTVCNRLASAVKIHKNAIAFADSIGKYFSLSYLILMSFGVASLSINLYRLTLLLRMVSKIDAFMVAALICAHFFYMFWCNYAGQELINFNTDLYLQICNAQWYTSSVHNQKMLIFILRRSDKPPLLGVSNLFVGSIENFGTLVSMSLSYFTVIYSVR